MMQDAVKVSIIIPVYNAARLLHQALDSALGQTLTEIEVIAVDDCSADGSGKILAERAAADPRLRVFTQPENSGTLSVRRRGIRESRGEYLLFLDPDDFLDLNTAEELSRLADGEKASVIHFGTREFKRLADGSMKPIYDWTPPMNMTVSGDGEVLRELLRSGCNWSLCFKLIRRDICMKALDDTEDFFCIMAEDFYFYLAVSFHAEKLIQISRPYYNYDTTIGITSEQAMPPEKFYRMASLLDALRCAEDFLRQKELLSDPELADGWEKIARGQCRILWNQWHSRLAPGTRGEVVEYLLHKAWDKELFLLSIFDENNYLRENEEFLKFASGIYKILNYIFPRHSFLRLKLKMWYKKWKYRRQMKI